MPELASAVLVPNGIRRRLTLTDARRNLPDDDAARRDALAVICDVRGRAISGEYLADHLLAAYGATPWDILRASAEAVRARLCAVGDEKIVVKRRPSGAGYGVYKTGEKTGPERPYRTSLSSLIPLSASCDCRDFVRNGLGLCKHVLTVLDDLSQRSKRGTKPRFETLAGRPAAGFAIDWLPIRPLDGRADRFERLRFDAPFMNSLGRAGATLRRKLRASDVDQLRIGEADLDCPVRRRAIVTQLIDMVERKDIAPQISPAARAVLVLEAEHVDRVMKSDAAAALINRHARSMKLPLMPYQVEGVQRFLSLGRLLLADDMGLGKTAQAVAACHVLFTSKRIDRGLVIVPNSLKHQWAREWARFSDVPTVVIEGTPEERRIHFESIDRGFAILNYELLLRDAEMIRSFDADITVLDEAQRIKNWETQTSRATKTLRSPYRLVLTGTPMENRFEELASLLEWLGNDALDPLWRIYPLHRPGAGIVSNLDVIRTRFDGKLIRRTRPEVLSQLPPRRDSILSVKITQTQVDEQDALGQPIAKLIAIASRRPLTHAEFLRLMMLFTKQRMIANGMAQVNFDEVFPDLRTSRRSRESLLPTLDSPKLEEFREIIRDLAVVQRRKVVVFSSWQNMLKLAEWTVADVLESHGLRSVYFTGNESLKKRESNVIDFHGDASAAVFFATDAGSVGLNLQRASDVCINLDLPWNPAVLEQRIGRIWRLGQTNPIDVINLVTVSSIEERMCRILDTKKAVFTGLFDGTSDEIRFDDTTGFGAKMIALAGMEKPSAKAADVQVDDEDDADPFFDFVNAKDDEEMEGGGARGEAVDESRALPVAASSVDDSKPAPSTATLLDGVRIERSTDGTMTLVAPPAAAAALSKTFALLAQLLGKG